MKLLFVVNKFISLLGRDNNYAQIKLIFKRSINNDVTSSIAENLGKNKVNCTKILKSHLYIENKGLKAQIKEFYLNLEIFRRGSK